MYCILYSVFSILICLFPVKLPTFVNPAKSVLRHHPQIFLIVLYIDQSFATKSHRKASGRVVIHICFVSTTSPHQVVQVDRNVAAWSATLSGNVRPHAVRLRRLVEHEQYLVRQLCL